MGSFETMMSSEEDKYELPKQTLLASPPAPPPSSMLPKKKVKKDHESSQRSFVSGNPKGDQKDAHTKTSTAGRGQLLLTRQGSEERQADETDQGGD